MDRRGLALSFLAIAAGLFSALERAADADPAFLVIVNDDNPVRSLSTTELKYAVTGESKLWKNGAPILLGIIPGDQPETRYLGSVLGLDSRGLLARIQAQVFNGEMRRPVVLRSSSDCAAMARSNAGAICVVAAGPPIPPGEHVVTIQ